MHMAREFAGDEMRRYALRQPKIGAGFTEDEIKGAVRMELWQTLCNHPTDVDYYLFEIYDANGGLLNIKKVYEAS